MIRVHTWSPMLGYSNPSKPKVGTMELLGAFGEVVWPGRELTANLIFQTAVKSETLVGDRDHVSPIPMGP